MTRSLLAVLFTLAAVPAVAQSVTLTPATTLTCADGQVPLKAAGVWTCGTTGGTGTVITGSALTVGTIPKASGAAALVNSLLTESGTVVTVTGTMNWTAGSQLNGVAQQNVASGQSPTFTGTNFTGIPAASILAGTFGSGNYTIPGLLTVSGFGQSTFTGSGTGRTGVSVRNTLSGENWSEINLGSNTDEQVLVLNGYSSAFTTSNHRRASGGLVQAVFAGGLTLAATAATGDVFVHSRNAIAITVGAAQAVRMHAYGAGTATFDASGNITSVSDERQKDIQGAFTPGLNALMGIAPIRYRYKASTGLDTENVYAGFSAQNVRDFIPEAIGKNLDGMYSLNIVPVLAATVTAVQELAREVDELRAASKLTAKSRTQAKADDTRVINSATKTRLAEVAKAKADADRSRADCLAKNESIEKQGGKPLVCGGMS